MKKIRVRHKDGGFVEKMVARTTAIKIFCMECCGFESDPHKCDIEECALHPFRGRSNFTISSKTKKSNPTEKE